MKYTQPHFDNAQVVSSPIPHKQTSLVLWCHWASVLTPLSLNPTKDFRLGLSLAAAMAIRKLSNSSFETKPWWTLRCASDHCPVGRSSDAQASDGIRWNDIFLQNFLVFDGIHDAIDTLQFASA